MALQIAYTQDKTDVALPASYHRVNAFYADTLARVGRVEVAVYKDDAARLAGKDPVDVLQIPFGPAVFDALDNPAATTTRARAYAFLKTLARYQGAQDA